MNTSAKIGGLLAAVMLAASGSVMAAESANPYVVSSDNKVVMDPYGLCWRTGFWTPALAEAQGLNGAGCQCDKEILSKAACTAPVKAAPAPAPKAAPAPAPAPAPVKAAPKREKVTLAADALFDLDKAVIKPEGQAKLDELVSRLAGVDLEVINTTGHTDRLGKAAYNQKLSERRAEAVKAYLVKKGVAADVIKTAGKGSTEPVVNCPNPSKKGEVKNFKQLVSCLQPNRRAVIEVVGSRVAK